MIVRHLIPFKNHHIGADLIIFDSVKRELEYQLEVIRRKSFPDLPSRLLATFVIPNNDLYEDLWRPKMHLEFGYERLTLETQEKMIWFNAYTLDNVQSENLERVCYSYWESAKDIVNPSDQSFLCEAICSNNPHVLNVEYRGI